MTPIQQCKKFAAAHGLDISGNKNGVCVARGDQPDGIEWVTCFDNWRQCFEFFRDENIKIQSGELPVWLDLSAPFTRQTSKRRNPARRTYRDEADARRLAAQFHGREPGEDEYLLAQMPKMPDALANIGKVFAIEYLAERDGKVYRFRHVFKAKSRPHLAVSPDGTFMTMLGGAWFFGQDGFEDT